LTRDDILDIASQQFALHGYRGTNLGQVSDVLGVTRQAIYYYFPKKHDVLTALFIRFFDRLDAAVDAAVAVATGAKGSPGHRFTAMLEAHVRVVASDPALSSLFTEGRGSLPPGPAELVSQRRKAYNARFVSAYRQGVKSGELNGDVPATIATNLLLGAANWVFRWYDPEGRLSPEALARMVCRFQAAGFAAAAPGPSGEPGSV
jgi:AcrR family transcriptional regulator